MAQFRKDIADAFDRDDSTLSVSGSIDLKDKGAEIDFTKRF